MENPLKPAASSAARNMFLRPKNCRRLPRRNRAHSSQRIFSSKNIKTPSGTGNLTGLLPIKRTANSTSCCSTETTAGDAVLSKQHKKFPAKKVFGERPPGESGREIGAHFRLRKALRPFLRIDSRLWLWVFAVSHQICGRFRNCCAALGCIVFITCFLHSTYIAFVWHFLWHKNRPFQLEHHRPNPCSYFRFACFCFSVRIHLHSKIRLFCIRL